jgi:glycosyltransferase involved in cell wall biosynthesis
MRIAIITPFYPPSIGGVETIARDTAVEFARRGYDVNVVTTTHDSEWKKVADSGMSQEEGVIVHRLEFSWIRVGNATIMKELRQVMNKITPEIVHAHNLHPHLLQAIKWKKDLEYRIVAQLHHPIATGIDHLLARAIYPLTMRYLARKQSKIDAFVAHTDLEREWLVEEGIDSQKIHIVNYPCVPSHLLNYTPKPICNLEYPEKFVVLYVGRLAWRKGIHTLLEALPRVKNELDNVVTVVAGPRNERYYRLLHKLAHELELEDHILFKGPLSESEKYDYMGSCTVFSSPSIRDYTPITLIEAQALGTPVISTTVGSIPAIVKNRQTGLLVRPEDSEELAKTIKRVILDHRERNRLSANARQWIAENFLLESTVDKLERLYESIRFA